jgi:hypothetical protein
MLDPLPTPPPVAPFIISASPAPGSAYQEPNFTSCDNCHKDHRFCNRAKPSCSRCQRKSWRCYYTLGMNKTQVMPASCNECHRKKAKCDKAAPCGRCVRHKIKCVYDERRERKTGPTARKNKKDEPESPKRYLSMISRMFALK